MHDSGHTHARMAFYEDPEHEALETALEEVLTPEEQKERKAFLRFLRGLLMHAIVGTTCGGVMSSVGQPENILVATIAEWDFGEYFTRLIPVSMPVFAAGLITHTIVDLTKTFGYGEPLPESVRTLLKKHDDLERRRRTPHEQAQIYVQGAVSIYVVVMLGMQLATPGIVGLSAIVWVTVLNGITEEHEIGHAFQEALPFTALIVVFFAIVAMIQDQELFHPVVKWVIDMDPLETQLVAFYMVCGVLSMISDNVFVATIYITELQRQFQAEPDSKLYGNREEFDLLAVAINSGSNVLSVATPNGQAAFLFLLTSSAAPILGLTYVRMVWMALPYTIMMTLAGFFGNYFILQPATAYFLEVGSVPDHLPLDPAIFGNDTSHCLVEDTSGHLLLSTFESSIESACGMCSELC